MRQIDSSDVYGFLIAVGIMGLLVWSIYFSDKPSSTPASNPSSSTTSNPSFQPEAPSQNPVVSSQPQTAEPIQKSVSSPEFQLCQVRIVNTLNGTDKVGSYKAVMNDSLKTLTLTYADNPNEVIELTYQENEMNRLRLYVNGQMQAEKMLYRRTELETSDKEIVYTSRTGEVQVTITYD